MNLSKQQIKVLNSFKLKKNRDKSTMFLAEGDKLICDLLPNLKCHLLVATSDWLQEHRPIAEQIIEVDSVDEIKKASLLTTPTSAIALFYKREELPISTIDYKKELILCLDSIQDPGNMGTIMRVADWFGINHIICSNTTVDLYNPKTIQATMGAISRISVHYCDLEKYLSDMKAQQVPIYGTFLDGENLYQTPITQNGIIVMGNEGNGINSEIESIVTHKLLIPSYPAHSVRSESLNVAMATGIILAEFRRR